MRDITLVLPFFQNLGMLAEQQTVWAAYPHHLRSRLHVVVVDDCSPDGQQPTTESVTVDGLASFRIYRLTQKKRWNWLAARNLGAKLATTEWLLFTDMDHVLPLRTLDVLIEAELNPRDAYRFHRVDAPHAWPYALSSCSPYKGHPDTWLMTKALFFSEGVGGYDERLSGLYGTSGEFRDRVLKTARAHVMLPEVMVRYPREIIADASTSPDVYTRKGDGANDAEYRRRKYEREKIVGWRPLHGLIPYEEIYSSVREAVPA